jgi:hypothetical protein
VYDAAGKAIRERILERTNIISERLKGDVNVL